jgi:glycosyltransferase involved in cell wall biosynthesis
MQPLVSIVIPCFNQGRYLGEAIESAWRQTYPHVEVLVVDDGSTDETPQVVEARPGVGYRYQANGGTAAARNHGLGASSGAFVLFLDADDRLLPDAVATGVGHLLRQPDAAFVTGHARLMRADGSPWLVPVQEHDAPGYETLLRDNYIWTPGLVLYRRAALEAAGGFDPWAGGSADYDLNIRIARQQAFACHHAVVLDYRQHEGSMTGDPGYMLRSAVSVRRRERRHAAGRGAHQAWRAGLQTAQAHFGARLIDRIKGDLVSPHRRWRAVHGLWCLLCHHPRGLAAMLAPREWPKLMARRWRTAAR